jgi:hypothetical protein
VAYLTPDFEEIVMDSYRQDSVHTSISGLDPADFKTLTPEENATYRSWRRAVMAFYCAVLLLGGVGLMVSIPVSHPQVAEVMPPVNVP